MKRFVLFWFWIEQFNSRNNLVFTVYCLTQNVFVTSITLELISLLKEKTHVYGLFLLD